MLKLIPLENSIPLPWIVALPLNFKVPVFVSTYSEYLLNSESSPDPRGGPWPFPVVASEAGAAPVGPPDGICGPEASDSFMPLLRPRFAANPPVLGFIFRPGTSGAELKFGACGRPGGSLSPPGAPMSGPPGLDMLEGARLPLIDPLGAGAVDVGIWVVETD